MIKLFGIIILAIRFEFGDRASMWYTFSQSNYRPDPDSGNINMNRPRFDVLYRHVQWSHQTGVQDEGTIHENHWWENFKDFLTDFSEYCTQLFSPSDLICVDSTYRGGMIYVAMYMNPDNGSEIQNYACGSSEIMMQLSIGKFAMNEAEQ